MARNTKQYDRAVTGRRSRIIVLALILAVCAASVIGGLVYRSTRPYEAPPFDETAVRGIPTPPEELGFGYGGAGSADSFRAGLVSRWKRAGDGSLPIWFTNPPENTVNLLLRIRRDSDNRIIYQSGLVRPGEYVEKLTPLVEIAAEPFVVKASIYSFDEAYHSLGTLPLSGTVD